MIPHHHMVPRKQKAKASHLAVRFKVPSNKTNLLTVPPAARTTKAAKPTPTQKGGKCMKAFGEMAEQANAAIKQKHLEFINSYTTGPTGNIDDSAVTADGYALSDTVYTRE